MLSYVREALGHEIERSDLKALRKPACEFHVQLYRHGRSRGELLERDGQPMPTHDGRVDAARDIPSSSRDVATSRLA